jgi:Ca2+-transporting ATPase
MMNGLTSIQAAEKIKYEGYNELASAKPKNLLRIALEVIKEPMFLLLISCGLLYVMLGDYREGITLLSTIFIIIFITFYQYQKTEKSLEALKKISSPRALVIRDGQEIRIPGREVVPDDIIKINEGDRIPADAILLESVNITLDESLLTGESVPIAKNVPDDESDKKAMLFSGTLVVQGKGTAKVLATGPKTKFGQIGASLQSIEQFETRLQKEMRALIRNLFIAGSILSIGVAVAFYFTRGNLIQSVLNGLATAMAILPEEFPVVLTVFLALGAWRLSKKNVLTRKPSAIETLGSATVLCSDKTGTITQNKMELVSLFYSDKIFYKNDFSEKDGHIQDLIFTAFRASQKDSMDPMEKAIKKVYSEIFPEWGSSEKFIKEYSLSKQLFAMTRVFQGSPLGSFSVCCKGSPEAIFALCKMNDLEIAPHLININRMAEKGYRVIAVAKSTWDQATLPPTQYDFDFKFLGILAFEDPIRPEVPQAIQECNEAGIKVILITGDFPSTATSIASQIGLLSDGSVLTGQQLKQMNDAQLQKAIKTVNVFARIIPEQKLQIVKALKANGEIVAMTGDGVNDAPALKAADIGVAMGGKGTDVAREASSLVLLDDNFFSIVSAIRSGRKIYDNLQKAMSYIIAIHVPIIGIALLPAFFPSLPLLLMPIHIVFLELIIDPVCSIAFESEQEELGIMQRPPRIANELFFGWSKMVFSLTQGLILLAMVFAVYFRSLHEGHQEGEVRAMAFTSLVIGNVFLIITSLSKSRNFISVLMRKNLTVPVIIGIVWLLMLLIISVPALQQIFAFQFPEWYHFGTSLTGAMVVLLLFETYKYFKTRVG